MSNSLQEGRLPPAAMTVPELLATRARREPEHVAMVVDGHGSLTLGEWQRRSDAVAGGLIDRGLRPGERVGLFFGDKDWISFAVACCAVQKAGAVAVPLSDRLAPAEVGHLLGDCTATGVVHADGARPQVGDRWSCTLAEAEADHDGPVGVTPRPGDLAQILYTSGTTGRPKAVAASHANLTQDRATHPRRRRFAHSRRLLHAFPIGTNAGQTMLMNALDASPTVLSPGRFTPGRFARLIESQEVGTVFVVPSMAIELLNAGLHERHDLSSVLLLGSSAAALPPALSLRLAAAFPNATVTNYYTSTEAAPAQTVMVFDPARPGALGRPASGSALRVSDETGAPLPAGRTGEIWLHSPAPRSYYGDDAASAEVFRDGWVRMGDLGYLDADGFLYLVDRESDVVKSGAFKVSTLRVEAVLYEHPDVAEAAVLGVEHPVLGTALVAAVVSGGRGLSVSGLRVFLRERLALHELPQQVVVLDGLPRNRSGKVVKGDLRALLDGHREGV